MIAATGEKALGLLEPRLPTAVVIDIDLHLHSMARYLPHIPETP
jgi:hypothetical protein